MTNVIYFRDAWTIPFDLLDPRDSPLFTMADGGAVSGVKMMSRSSYEFGVKKVTFDELRGVEFNLVSIPYQVKRTMPTHAGLP
jgi:hypothetical protein